jgi:hypothetical protein
MRIKDLGSRPAPASLREIISRFTRGQVPTTQVERRQIPYWQESGWTRQGDNTYTGNYQTRYAAFQGWIERDLLGHYNFYLYGPSRLIHSHSHWSCFVPRGNDWYIVHMARQPKDVSSGIITIERLITEAYQ